MLQNLQNSAIFQKLQLDNLVDFEKCCKTRIQLQRSAPTQPKMGEILPKIIGNYWSRSRRRRVGRRADLRLQRPIGKISAICCSFSAVSAPIFATKYAFCSIFQNLPDYLVENFEIWQNFEDFTTFAKSRIVFSSDKSLF